MQTRILTVTLLGVVASAAIGVIGFEAYETRKPHQEQTSPSIKMEVYGANKVYRTCQGIFYDGKLDAGEFMLLCMRDARKERERQEARLATTPAKSPRTADASR